METSSITKERLKERNSLQLIAIEVSKAGVACGVLGILLLVGGFIAYCYEEKLYFDLPPLPKTEIGVRHPYRDLGIPLIILGVVSIIVGAVLSSIKKPQVERIQERVSVSLMRCPKCGTNFAEGYVFCPYCKVKLEPA